MGQVVIDIPQNVFGTYQIDDSEFGKRLLADLQPFSNGSTLTDVNSPRRTDRQEVLEKVTGIWSNRNESGREIARKIRENNRKVT